MWGLVTRATLGFGVKSLRDEEKNHRGHFAPNTRKRLPIFKLLYGGMKFPVCDSRSWLSVAPVGAETEGGSSLRETLVTKPWANGPRAVLRFRD